MFVFAGPMSVSPVGCTLHQVTQPTLPYDRLRMSASPTWAVQVHLILGCTQSAAICSPYHLYAIYSLKSLVLLISLECLGFC